MKTFLCTFLAICCLSVGFYGLSHPGEGRACHHDGRLDHIPEGSTWRVRFSSSEGKLVILGVCKRCGRVTDLEQQGEGFYMHLPLAGNPLYDESLQAQKENLADDPGEFKGRPL